LTIVTAKGEVFSYGGLLRIKGFKADINWNRLLWKIGA